MKKQFLILAATLITVAFISCSKGIEEMPEMKSTTNEEIATSSSSKRSTVNPLSIALEARFEFNGNLKSMTRGIADGVTSRRGADYGFDRKGNFNGSLYLDGAYFVKLTNIPQQTNTSLSLWIKPTQLDKNGDILQHELWHIGPNIGLGGPYLTTSIFTGVSTPGGSTEIFNTSWRHVVITFDGENVRIYVNSVLKHTIPHKATIPPTLSDFFIGWGNVWGFWTGYVDDLRFYSRTLSASDVQNLYDL